MNIKDILSLDPHVLAKYLHIKGWQKGRYKNGIFSQYISEDRESVVLIPFDKEYDDYVSVLEQTLHSVANQEHITIFNLLTVLTSPPSDILRWRINNSFTTNGLIPLSNIDEVLDSIQSIIASVAADITTPSSYHKKIMVNEVKELLNTYSLGQTERGSYILNLLCPLGCKQLEFFEDPISRRINEKLLTDIVNIQSNIIANNRSKIEDEIFQNKYSINFLDAIVNLNEAVLNTELEINVNWNIDLPIRDDILSTAIIDPHTIEDIASIADKLRPVDEPTEKRFFGKISSIKTAPELTNRDRVSIIVASIDENEKKINLNIDLDYSLFEEVNRAFENGLTVNVKGTLSSTPKKKFLIDSSFEVIDD